MLEHIELIEAGAGVNYNQSRVQLFITCHRKYYWQFIEGLVPDRPRWPLLTGTAVHLGLAELSVGTSVDEAVKRATEKFESELPARRLPGEDEIIADQLALIRKMLPAYAEYWSDDQTFTPLGVEAAGRVEVGKDSGIFLVFRIDKLVLWNRQIWVLDHKTAAKLDMRDLMKYEMDLQMSSYIYGASVVLRKPVSGVIVDLLVKTTVPQFHRELFNRSEADLRSFEEEYVEAVQDIEARKARCAAGEDPKTVFYKNTSQCLQYGKCPYRDLCLRDNPAQRMMFAPRTSDYVDDLSLLRTTPQEAADAQS